MTSPSKNSVRHDKAASVSRGPILAVYPEVLRYSAIDDEKSGEAQLVRKLRSQQDTKPVGIFEETDVLLDELGLVQGMYRMTTIAMAHLCRALAPGLFPLLQNLAGMRKRRKQFSHEEYSVKSAINLLNSVIRTRFDILRSKFRFILDRRNCIIEGVVGPKYHFMSNMDMYEHVRRFFEQMTNPPRFLEGVLSGRRLQLRYKNPERCFALPTPIGKLEPFYCGWHFLNSELGDCCVKGSALLFRAWTGAVSLRPYADNTKLVHVRHPNFNERIYEVFSRVHEQVVDTAKLESKLTRLSRKVLGFSEDSDLREKRYTELLNALKKGGLTQQTAEDVIEHTMTQGSYKAGRITAPFEPASRSFVSPEVLQAVSGRTSYDLYNSLCVIARKYQPESQEAIEQVAFRLLNGKLKLSKKEH